MLHSCQLGKKDAPQAWVMKTLLISGSTESCRQTYCPGTQLNNLFYVGMDRANLGKRQDLSQ